MTRLLIPNPPPGLRERRRSDGTTRLWWEPAAKARALGFSAVELDEKRLTWSRRQAEQMNKDVAAAQKGGQRAPRASARSIEALAEHYQRGLTFRQLASKTQVSYRANLRLIIRKWGPQMVGEFTKPVMRTWYETLFDSAGAHQAMAQIRMMSILFSHAEMIGWRAEGSNPCLRLRMRTPKGRVRMADWAEVDQMIAAADRAGLPSIGTAILLSLFQGQRQTDVREARIGDFTILPPEGDHGDPRVIWSFTRSKRGNAGALFLHDEVRARIMATIAAARRDGATADRALLVDERIGRAYDQDLFSKRWAEVRAAAIKADPSLTKLHGLQFRDLRRTFGILSRRGGASKDDTADVLGNSAATNAQLAQIYMPGQIETASRAVQAIKRPGKTGRKAG